MKDLASYLLRQSALVNRQLDRLLPSEKTRPSVVHRAMRYSVNAGGKRLRPVLVMAAAELCGGSAASVLPTACALELIHTYSLIHDDLPAMDDDDLRRGRPTNHRVFGEDIAILAGDALLTIAFQLIAANARSKGIKIKAIPAVIEMVARWAGTHGMIGGQVADISADGGRWHRLKGKEFRSAHEWLEFIHLNKTAALIRASVMAGALLAGASPKETVALDGYAKNVGLAFQITDDVLDRTGDKSKLGKRGSDLENKKLTYPAVFGIEASKRRADRCIRLAHRSLTIFGGKSWVFHELADFVTSRDH